MIYNVECTRGRKRLLVKIFPTDFHAFVRTTLKQKISASMEGRRDQLQKYFAVLTDYCDLTVKDWSLDDVEATLNDRLKQSLAELDKQLAPSKPKNR
jgi:hypothetical protein